MVDYDAVVIGAGCGGVTAGALLASQGRRVLLLEQSERIGGCCSTFERDGYCFDVGASIIELTDPIERAFKALGTRMTDELDLFACDPIMSCILPDGKRITYPHAMQGTVEALSNHSSDDARNWHAYANYFGELTDVVYDTLFSEPSSTWGDLVRMARKNSKLLKYLPVFFTSYQNMIQKYFESDRVLQSFAYQSFYFGLPPELLAGPFALIPHAEHRGVYYARGGMIQVPRALQCCGERFGMETRLNTRVDRVLVRNRRAIGVRLADGTEITSRLVVSNVNAKTLYLKMIGEEYLPSLVRRGIKSYEFPGAVPMLYLGVNYEPPLASQHSIISPSMREVNDFWRYRAKKPIPDRQFGLISWPTYADKSLAPSGKHVLNVVPMGGRDLGDTDWDSIKSRFMDNVINYLSSGPVPDLAQHVEVALCATPKDFERRLLLPHGTPFGLPQDLVSQTVFRPANKSKCIQGLYLAGASTNPGAAVPTTIASGLITAKLVEKYE